MLQDFKAWDLPPAPFLGIMSGLPGAGKSTIAAKLAGPAAVLSSDDIRRELSGGAPDHRSGWLSLQAFATIRLRAAARLEQKLSAVVDSTGLEARHRRVFLDLAAELGVPAVAVFVDAGAGLAWSRNAARGLDTRVPRVAFDAFAALAENLWEALLEERPAQAWRLDGLGRVRGFRWFPAPPREGL